MVLPPSNLQKVLGLVKNELKKQKYVTILFYASDLSRFEVNVLKADN